MSGDEASLPVRRRLLLAAVVALIAAAQLYPLLSWSTEALTRHAVIRDDAFFYAELARNYHESGFLTFDGEMPTNGVQPLWMVVLIALTGLLPGVGAVTMLARASWFFYALFAWLATLLVARGSPGRALGSTLAFSAMITLNPWFQHLAIRGLETPLLLVVLALFLLWVDRSGRIVAAGGRLSATAVAGLAALSVLCFLCRTDLFWLCAASGAWLMLRQRGSTGKLWLYGGTSAGLVLPYLLYNLVAHGGLMPISGRAKRFYFDAIYRSWSEYVDSQEWWGLFEAFRAASPVPVGSSLIHYGVPLLLASLALYACRDALRRGAERVLPAGLHVLGWTTIAHVLFMYAWYRELRPYSAYYFVVEVLFAAMMLVVLAPRWLRRHPRLDIPGARRVACFLVIAISLGLIGAGTASRFRAFKPTIYWAAHLAMVEELDRLPDGVTVGAYWPGALGALSKKKVIPLDGIIGSHEFFEQRVKQGRDLDYLLERPRPHLAIYLHRSPQALLSAETFPRLRFWNRTGELQLWRHRHCRPEVLAGHPVLDDGTGWYLLRFPEACPGVPGTGYE